MAVILAEGKQQYTDSAGAPLAGGQLWTYAAGTSTPLATYSDSAGTAPNTNPVTLDARGEAAIYWAALPYKVTLKDAGGATIWTVDNITSGLEALASTASGKGAALVAFQGGGTVQDLASTASGKGAALVGYRRTETGAALETVALALDKQLPSIMQLIPEALHAAIYAKTSTTDVSAYFQAIVDLGVPFTVPAGAKFRLSSPINWKSGAKMLSYGDEYFINTSAAYRTVLEWDSDACSSGITMNAPAGDGIKNWAWKGLTLTTIGAGWSSFKMWHIQNGGGVGAQHFSIEDVTINRCDYGLYADDALFSGTFRRFLFSLCRRGFYKTTTDFITSLSGDVNFFQVFAPWTLNNTVYCSINSFIDHCGLQAPSNMAPSATEMPILVNATGCYAVDFPYLGIENSKAMIMNADNFSILSAGMSYFQPVADIWVRDSARVSNVIEAEQGLFRVKNSQVAIRNLRALMYTAGGYPAASTNPAIVSYVCQLLGTAGVSKLTFANSTVAFESYCVHPTGQQGFSAPALLNGPIAFGATALTPFNGYLDYSNGFLTVGQVTNTTETSHAITGIGAYAEGNRGLVVRGAVGGSGVIFNAVNGANGNAANAAMRVPLAASNNRSINAGGTVNASGADYAEYERNNGLSISKGQIVGFKADGTLTLTYSEAVRFGVKSTSPSYVGGDTWCTAVEPEDGAPPEAWEAFRTQLEVDRQQVDRIAYSGKVPCNVGGAAPGQYIVAEPGPGDTIIGVPVSDPDLSQYRRAVGRVNRLLPDGRAEVAVIVH
jgi:hypothetical protein